MGLILHFFHDPDPPGEAEDQDAAWVLFIDGKLSGSSGAS
jgi:hypothetical protein